jgi:hypothetical protein
VLLPVHVAELLGDDSHGALVEPHTERHPLRLRRALHARGERGEVAVEPLDPRVVRLEVGEQLGRDRRDLGLHHAVLVLGVLFEEPHEPPDGRRRAARLLHLREVRPRDAARHLVELRPQRLVDRAIQIDASHAFSPLVSGNRREESASAPGPRILHVPSMFLERSLRGS